IWQDDLDANPEDLPELERILSALPSLEALRAELQPQLLKLGVNPGGPAASIQQTPSAKGVKPAPWTSLYDWAKDPVATRFQLSEREQQLEERIYNKLQEEMLQGLYSGAGRDFESLGLGWLCLASDSAPLVMAPSSTESLVRASLRILGHMRRFEGLRWGQ